MTETSTQETQSTESTPSIEEQIAQLEQERSKAAKTAQSSPSIESIEAVDRIDTELGKRRKLQLAVAAKREADRAKRAARLNDATLKELGRTYAATRQRAAKAIRRAAELEREQREVLRELDACGAELTRCSREARPLGGVLKAHTSIQLVQMASGHAGSLLGGAGRNVSLLHASGSAGPPGAFDPLVQLEEDEESAGVLVSVRIKRPLVINCPDAVEFAAGQIVATTQTQATDLITHQMAEQVE